MSRQRSTTPRLEVRPGRSKPYGVIWYEGAARHKKTQWFTEEAEARATIAAVAETLAALEAPPLVGRAPAGAETFGQYCTRWLEAGNGARKRSTQRFYKVYLAKIDPILGHRPANGITRQHCKDLLKALEKHGYNKPTIACTWRTLRAVLGELVDDGIYPANPAARLGHKIGKGDEKEPEPRPLSEAQLTQYLHNAKYLEPHWYPLLVTLARQGPRIGEACELRWVDDRGDQLIDLEAGSAWVIGSRSLGEATSTKSKKPRVLDLGTQTITVLRPLLLARQAALKAGKASPYVFLTPAGTRVQPDGNLRRVLRRVAAGEMKGRARRKIAPPAPLGVRPITVPNPITGKLEARTVGPHELRDTYATLQLTRGVPDLYVSEQLGHADSVITRTRYARWIRSTKHDYANALEAIATAAAPDHLPSDRPASELRLVATKARRKLVASGGQR